MLTEPFLKFVRANAPLEGNFSVGLPETYVEIDNGYSEATTPDLKILLRDHVLSKVVRPLINASSSIRFYRTTFSKGSFGGEGARLSDILKKVGRHYELIKGHDPINSFEKFWNGVEGDGSARGYVLFTIDDAQLDLSHIFSFCYDPAVKSVRSWRSAWGATLYGTVVGHITDNPNATAILLEHAGSLSSLTAFPGATVFSKRLEEAISSTRTYAESMSESMGSDSID